MSREHDPTDLAGQEKIVKDRAETLNFERKQVAADIKRLMGADFGRRILWRLLSDTGVFKSTFRLNNEMAFLEGRRSVGLEFLALVNETCPENYIKMLEEYKQK
jgi:hypothetical protein